TLVYKKELSFFYVFVNTYQKNEFITWKGLLYGKFFWQQAYYYLTLIRRVYLDLEPNDYDYCNTANYGRNGSSANTGQWLTTIFMLVNGIMIPVTAFLIERFTTRQLFTTAMSIFTVGTFFAAIAFDFNTLIMGRI